MTGRVVKMSGPEPARMASMSRESPDVICASLWISDRPALEPVPEVVPHVVPAEGLHGEGVAAHPGDLVEDGRGALRRPRKDPVVPVEGLEDQRHHSGPAARGMGKGHGEP